MSTFLQQPRELLEFAEVALLFLRQKAEAIEKRNDILDDCGEVVDLVVPDTVLPPSQRSALQMSLEQGQNDLVTLRYVEAQRHFPRLRVVLALSKRHVETALAVGEASQVVADRLRDLRSV